MSVICVHRDPFSLMPRRFDLPEGASLADMAARIETLPEGWPRHEHDVIAINGHVIPRGCWPMIRPKPVAGNGCPVVVEFFAPPMGGGGSGDGKNVAGLLASIALTVATGGIASGTFLGGLSGSISTALGIGAGVGRGLLAAGVGLLGSTVLSRFAPGGGGPPPSTGAIPGLGSASIAGNTLSPNGAIPRVLGARRVFPPFACHPLAYYDGQAEVVEVVFALAGPHDMTEPRFGEVDADEIAGVQYEYVTGWPGEVPLTLVKRYGKSDAKRQKLEGHKTQEDGLSLDLAMTDGLEAAVPQPVMGATGASPDEIWLDLNFPAGLYNRELDTQELRVPIRVRIRRRGETDWLNLPELHYKAAVSQERRCSIRLIWLPDDLGMSAAETGTGWVEARVNAPGQAVEPVTTTYTADASFYAGSGSVFVKKGTGGPAGSSGVRNVLLGEHEAKIYFNENTHPRGEYEVEVKRGYTFVDSIYDDSSYTIVTEAPWVRDFFGYEASGQPHISTSRKTLIDEVALIRLSSVWNAQPVRDGNLALVAIKARDVQLEPFSVLARGYVRDWDGTGWNDWALTDNPAPYIRDILGGTLNADPVPDEIIDGAGLVDFRTACTTEGYSVNAVIDDASVMDALTLAAGAGYALPYHSELFGVARDKDRSADDPVQYFSPHNMADYSFAKEFARLPAGLRITYFDAGRNEARQITEPEGAWPTIQVSYDALVTEADARARARYELGAMRHRATIHSWTAPAEALVCRKGSLVGLTTDVLHRWGGSGRIEAAEFDGSGDVTAIILDTAPTLLEHDDWADIDDLRDVDDIGLIGLRTGVTIRRAGGAATTHGVTLTSDGTRLVLDTPATLTGLARGDLAMTGVIGREVRRLVVVGMTYQGELTWRVNAVDEAPELWS